VFSTSPTGLGNIGTVENLNAKAAGCFNLSRTDTRQADTAGAGWISAAASLRRR
jgi:hypothetical protein